MNFYTISIFYLIFRMEIVTDNRIDSIHQEIYEDMTHLFDANLVFRNDITFLKNIIEKFEYGFHDTILEKSNKTMD